MFHLSEAIRSHSFSLSIPLLFQQFKMAMILLILLSESIPQQLRGRFVNLAHSGTTFSTALEKLKLGSHARTTNGLLAKICAPDNKTSSLSSLLLNLTTT
uniref:Uncharacterized protein n=1 Tax=Solanum lycopersicum TaxID=4081 RepID=K4BH99_SOLLC